MAELSAREKALVHLMTMLMNPTTMKIPLELRVTALQSMLMIRNIKISEDELKDLSFAVEYEQKASIQEGFKFLDKHKDLLKNIGDLHR